MDRANTRENVHLYTGHAAYKIANDTASWNNPDEIPNQIKYNTERFNQVKGSVFFSYKKIEKQPGLASGTVSFRILTVTLHLYLPCLGLTGSHPLPLL
ncbi:hypothetical protein P7H20_13640 [Paenibacillus larvae]|nr:hypothetical protein [Paenibacillus larvae]MDT2275664.1 hypothetical protein [Paenibacillus larvae]